MRLIIAVRKAIQKPAAQKPTGCQLLPPTRADHPDDLRGQAKEPLDRLVERAVDLP